MSIDLVICTAAVAFAVGLFVGLFRGWGAANQRWYDAARSGHPIEGDADEYDCIPQFTVYRTDMAPIDFVPAKPCEQCESEESRHSE